MFIAALKFGGEFHVRGRAICPDTTRLDASSLAGFTTPSRIHLGICSCTLVGTLLINEIAQSPRTVSLPAIWRNTIIRRSWALLVSGPFPSWESRDRETIEALANREQSKYARISRELA
jgi:hypothetical protein